MVALAFVNPENREKLESYLFINTLLCNLKPFLRDRNSLPAHLDWSQIFDHLILFSSVYWCVPPWLS